VGEVDQVIHTATYDELPVFLCRLMALVRAEQKTCGDLPLLFVRGPEIPFELGGRHSGYTLRPERQFPGNTEILESRKPVPGWNRFRSATQIAWCTREILAEAPFRAKANFGTSILRRHAKACPLCISTQGFGSVREID
jgi:hypothetical protein